MPPARVVGLGASAGGLEAFEQFLRAMPADSGMAFVLVQHLDPSHASILTEILQRSTTMPVVEAQDQMPVLAGRVHVIPPNRDMVIFHGALQLSLPAEPRGQRLPIDGFLRSLADDLGDAAVGIILSGTGSDGTHGLGAIHAAGGLCLVQTPASARYDGMPSNAIAAGFATRVLAVEDMPQALRDGTRTLLLGPGTAPGISGGLLKILMQLRSATGHDFSQYKPNTIARRVERRMALHGIAQPEVYARHLKAHPDELQALFHELLINVTSFFRDPAAFAALKTDILPGLLAAKAEGQALRVWVAGCASGEEAYSLAMVLREHFDAAQQAVKVQLYATDLDADAIATARGGLYPAGIAQDVSPERLQRFFTPEEHGLRVKKEIREMVVFAVQSVIKDPPFTRLDLLACRNLMIYLEPALQNRLIPVFHYALRPGGVLFLSPSEGIGNHTELFEPINRKCKLYRAKPGAGANRALVGSGLAWATDAGTAPAPAGARRPREAQLADLARRMLLQVFAPAAVLTDLQGQVLFVHGETGRYLRPAPGQPSFDLLEMARDGLQSALREALRRAADDGLPTPSRAVRLHSDGTMLALALGVRPLADPEGGPPLLLVSFLPLADDAPPRPARKPRGGASADALRIQALNDELAQAREGVSAMLEEQQASNEELKSTNEELQSTNEELQSTNEEMETSKEELQSVNEELVTVNAELQSKIEQMAGMQDDIKNLLDNLQLGTIFLDRQLLIRRFTRDATRVFRLVATDVGRSLADIRTTLVDGDLLAEAAAVLDTLEPVEREVRISDGSWYLARIRPYRTVDNFIDGVVLTFADVTERVQALAARKARSLAEAIVDTVHEPLLVLEPGLNVISANRAYCARFGTTAEATLGQPLFEIGGGRWNHAVLRQQLQALAASTAGAERRTLALDLPAEAGAVVHLSLRRIAEQDIDTGMVLLAIDPLPAPFTGGPP